MKNTVVTFQEAKDKGEKAFHADCLRLFYCQTY